jgi:hypothetical protein
MTALVFGELEELEVRRAEHAVVGFGDGSELAVLVGFHDAD